MARNVGVQHLRGVLANIPALLPGELYLATDTGQLYVGSPSGNLPVGSGGGGNAVQATVDFGTVTGSVDKEETTATATVPAAWVTALSVLVCTVTEGPDHSADEVAAEGIEATAGNIVPGVSFDVTVWAPNGTQGRHVVNVRG